MSSLSSVKFLREDLNFSEVDECLAEIIELRRVKQVHTANKNEIVAANTSVDSDASMRMEDGKPATLSSSQPRVLCSMPYNQDNRLEVVLTALDFARHKQQRDGSSGDIYAAAASASSGSGSGSGCGSVMPDHHVPLAAVVMSSADNFEAELAHRRKLELLSSWRHQLMSKLEIKNGPSPGGGGRRRGGDDNDDSESDTDERNDDCDNDDPFVLSRGALLADLDDLHLEKILDDCL
jgi:hypothetical protein